MEEIDSLNRERDQTDEPDAADPERWVRMHADSLYAYAIRRLRNPDAAEEVVQDTFLAALKNVAQFQQTGSEGAWLMGILKRKVIDFARKQARRELNVDTQDSALTSLFDEKGNWSQAVQRKGPFSLDRLEQQEFRVLLKECLDRLPNAQALVFRKREMEQISGEDVCKELAITPSNLWVLMHRARLRLATCIGVRWKLGES